MVFMSSVLRQSYLSTSPSVQFRAAPCDYVWSENRACNSTPRVSPPSHTICTSTNSQKHLLSLVGRLQNLTLIGREVARSKLLAPHLLQLTNVEIMRSLRAAAPCYCTSSFEAWDYTYQHRKIWIVPTRKIVSSTFIYDSANTSRRNPYNSACTSLGAWKVWKKPTFILLEYYRPRWNCCSAPSPKQITC